MSAKKELRLVVVLATFFVVNHSQQVPTLKSPALQPIQEIGQLELPTAAYWDESRQCLFFVDVYQSSIHKYIPSTRMHTWTKVGTEPIKFIIPIQGTNDNFIISYGPDVGIVTWDGKNGTNAIYQAWVSLREKIMRVNEGKVSPSGSLFIGCYGGQLYVIDKNGGSRKITIDVRAAKGMAWSADESTFYIIDSVAHTVSSYAYNKTTDEITNRTVLLNYLNESLEVVGQPEGMAIDKDGKLWITSFGGASVLQFDPATLKVIKSTSLDAYEGTSVAFGGPALKDMYVTTARYDLSNFTLQMNPLSGYIFEQKNSATAGRSNTHFQINKLSG